MGRWRCALLVGRFHAITRVQAAWIAALRDAPVERIVCVVTGADRSGTRRNPLAAADREGLVRPLLARTGKPFDVVRCRDVPDDADWVRHLLAEVDAATGSRLEPSCATLYASNHEVDALFAAAGFPVVTADFPGPSPMELLQRIAHGAPWHEDASDETRALYAAAGRAAWLRGVFDEPLVNDDGELGHQRDFDTYGAQMDASLRQKLTELLPWVKPGCVVDKGCGTGRLLVELSRVFPTSAFVGVDLSRELLRRSDEQTYASEDVELVRGNITERNVAAGRATTVIFSSVMHEVYSYGGYRREAIHRALESARDELVPGGLLLVRDGVSPGDAPWRLELLTPAARDAFDRFAQDFKHGAGAAHERLRDGRVRLSAHLANEFLCKKDYAKNWHIEVHEEYGAHTLNGWCEALERAGLRPVHLAGTVNPWIVEHRYEAQVKLADDSDASIPWPATNCVVVGERPLERSSSATGSSPDEARRESPL